MPTPSSKKSAPRPAGRKAAARPRKAAPRPRAALASAVTPEERQQMIALAAYLRAERRGFTPGAEMSDWLEAEAEVDARLSAR
jgi:hypothetical protein